MVSRRFIRLVGVTGLRKDRYSSIGIIHARCRRKSTLPCAAVDGRIGKRCGKSGWETRDTFFRPIGMTMAVNCSLQALAIRSHRAGWRI